MSITDEHNSQKDISSHDTLPSTVLKARIALLATAIGGPDYTSKIYPPPYKLGDDCLSCLKDLIRWFRLVDDQQKRCDVAVACAHYNILINDLIPIIIDWENKNYVSRKIEKSNELSDGYSGLKNKNYHDKIALCCLQLMNFMTWPLELNDQSNTNEVLSYSFLKMQHLLYKKNILIIDGGRVLKCVIRLAIDIMKLDKLCRTPRDYSVLRIILQFIRNLLAIEPNNSVYISSKTKLNDINRDEIDMLPSGVTMDDITLNSVIQCFHENKVFDFLLTLTNSLNKEFDSSFLNVTLMEINYYLTKDLNPKILFSQITHNLNGTNNELMSLLMKEQERKTLVMKTAMTRHTRFGGLVSIKTNDNNRFTVSGTKILLDEDTALEKLDQSKKWNKVTFNTLVDEDSITTTQFLNSSSRDKIMAYSSDLIDSLSFTILLNSTTDFFTSSEDSLTSLQKIQFLKFFSWFINYQHCRFESGLPKKDLIILFESLKDTSFILVLNFLREAFEHRNSTIVNFAMIAITDFLNFINLLEGSGCDDIVNEIKQRLFSNERIALFSHLPRTAMKHSTQYIKSCVRLNHVILKTLESMEAKSNDQHLDNETLLNHTNVLNFSKENDIDFEEAFEILSDRKRTIRIDFSKVLKLYIFETTISTYIGFLERFKELDDGDIKKALQFLHRVFVQAQEESFLFRFDFLITLKEMLNPSGLSKKSRVRKHLDKFADYFMLKLKKRLKESPSWYINILFPRIHDRELGYYQRYAERRSNNEIKYSSPTLFRNTKEMDDMDQNTLKDLKFGILVSNLLDHDKKMHLDVLLENMVQHLKFLNTHNHSSLEIRTNNKIVSKDLNRDPDFRALLQLSGYQISNPFSQSSVLLETVTPSDFEDNIKLVKKYMEIPFHTPNNQLASTYLIQPGASYEDEDCIQVDQVEEDYFQELNTMDEKIKDKQMSRGTARSKNKVKHLPKKNGNNSLSKFDIDDTININASKNNIRGKIISKEYISDSDDGSENEGINNPIFFENEMYMRWLLDNNQGQIPAEKYSEFARFSTERLKNQGSLINNYTTLFNGPVPSLEDLKKIESNTNKGIPSFMNSFNDQDLQSAQIFTLPEYKYDKNVGRSANITGDVSFPSAKRSSNFENDQLSRKRPKTIIHDDDDDE